MKQIKHALKHKKSGKLVGYCTSSNRDGEFCCDTQYILEINDDNIWYVDSKEHAEWVRHNSTEWFNAGYDTPTHYFKSSELIVVEAIITTKDIEVEIPSYEEMAKWKSKGNKKDFDFYMYQKKEHPEITYDLYDLKKMIRSKKVEKK